MNLKDKRVIIVGMARSGISAGLLCLDKGAKVTFQDLKDEMMLKEMMDEVRAKDVNFIVGRNPRIEELDEFDVMILSPGVPSDLPFIEAARNKKLLVMPEVELAYKYCMGKIIGITGSNGKTTTTSLVGHIIKDFNPNAKIVGNIGHPFTREVNNLNKEDYVVAELSSFQLETVQDFHPQVSAILNLTPDHLSRHKTFENYIQAKKYIYKNQDENDFCILNYDDLGCRACETEVSAEVIFFSMKDNLDSYKKAIFKKDDVLYLRDGQLVKSICSIDQLQIVGDHNVENVLAAIGICYFGGVPIESIEKGLITFKAVEHRIEYVGTKKGVKYFNDSKATNPDAAIKGLLAMKGNTIIIGGGLDKGNTFDEWLEHFSGKVKALILIGETSEKIAQCAEKYGFKEVFCVKGLDEATSLASEMAEDGENVLLSPACASWDMFESYEERGNLFKNLVKQLKG